MQPILLLSLASRDTNISSQQEIIKKKLCDGGYTVCTKHNLELFDRHAITSCHSKQNYKHEQTINK